MMEEYTIRSWQSAVIAYGDQPQNKIHWPKMRDTFWKMFSRLEPELTCKECTLEVLATAMAEIVASREDQKRCASFMVQSLTYASALNLQENPMPTFTSFELVNRANEIQQERYMPDAKPSEEKSEHSALQEQTETPPAPKPKPEKPKDNAETKTRKVVQLTDTFQTIAVFGSVSEAEKATGIRNIYRAVDKHSMAGGYFWCKEGDEEAVAKKAAIPRGGRPTGKKPKKEDPPKPQAYPVAYTSPCLLSDEELIDELKRRGYTGELNITKTIVL